MHEEIVCSKKSRLHPDKNSIDDMIVFTCFALPEDREMPTQWKGLRPDELELHIKKTPITINRQPGSLDLKFAIRLLKLWVMLPFEDPLIGCSVSHFSSNKYVSTAVSRS